MSFETIMILFSISLFLGMLILQEVGRRFGLSRRLSDPEGSEKGIGAIEGAVFGLLGLMIAFTFSGAASRFEDRRHLITEEANDIGTAYLRIDLLPVSVQPQMRQLFRDYLDSRLETYRHASHKDEAMKIYSKSVAIQERIWNLAIQNCNSDSAYDDACKLLIPSLNDMIDITTTRLMATLIHPPMIIFLLMGLMCLLSSLLAGYGMSSKSRNLMHMVIFAAIMCVTVYIILDMEYPRVGFITVENADQALIDLRKSMN